MSASDKREIAFIDRGIDDHETLLAGIRPDVEAVLLSDEEPALRQMARALKGRAGWEAIHVIAHGKAGEISFSSGALSLETLPDHIDELSLIGAAVADGGIRLWSCQTARGKRGRAFLVALADCAQADVRGSSSLVGSSDRGGTWTLDTTAVTPITSEAMVSYQGIMDTGTGTTVDNLNVLDAIKTNDTNGVEYIYWADISTFLTTGTNATQTVTIQQAFQAGQLLLTFQVGTSYYTIGYNSSSSVYYQSGLGSGFFLEQTDQYGKPVGQFDPITGQVVTGAQQALLSGISGSISDFVAKVNNLSLFSGSTQLITDSIDGGAGKDNIQGIASNAAIHNIIQGGAGADVLTGGLGSDYFVFARATDSPAAGQLNSGGQLAQTWDQITNFQVGSDKIDFSQLISDQSVASAGGVTAFAAGLAEFRWFGAQSANTTSMGSANGYGVWYTPDGSGGSYVYADTNGDGVADLKFDVAGVTALNPSDFIAVDPPSTFTVHINPIEPSQSNQWLINLADANAGVTVTGTVTHFTPSALLIVTLNGHNYTATVAANGTWSAVIPAADLAHNLLPDGGYTLAATVKVGSSTAASDSHLVTVDETPPSETISSTIGTNTGLTATISSGGLTKDNTLALSGTVSDANGVASVHVFEGSTDLGAATITGNTWTLTTAALSDGAHSFTAKAVDNAGNSTTTAAITATVDTTAPSETISSTIGTNTGLTATISSGGLTKDNTLALSGTVSDSNGVSSVHIFEGNTDLGAATITGNTWTLTTAALSDGAHSFTAKVVDNAGNSTTTAAITATVDTTAPSETISSTIGTDTGLTTTISSGGLTKDNTLALSGTVSDTNGVSSVHIFDGNTDLGAATITGNIWTLTTGALSDGAHSFMAKAADNAGNSTTTAAITATVDTTAPSETISSTIGTNTGLTTTISSGGLTKDNTLALSGTVSDANGLASVHVFDGSTDLGAVTITGNAWTLTTAALSDGAHSFSAKAVDTAGNSTTTGAITATVDTTAPTVSFDTVSFSDTGVQGDHITKTDSVTLSGSVGDDVHVQTVEVFDNGTSLGLATVSNGTWSLTTAVGQGSHNTWSATATDEAGNTTSAGNTTLVQVDTTAPTVSFDTVSFSDTGVQGDHITKTDSVTLSGSVGDDVHVQTVEVFDNGTSLGLATVSNGTWSLTTAVGQGSHNTWSATATDEAGNTTSAGNTTLVQVDTTAPTVSFDTVSFSDTGVQGDHITKTDSVTLSGSVGDDVHVQTVEVFDNGTSLGLATVSNGTWSLTTAVGQGSHNTWSATATDEAGNTTSAGNTTLVQVDTTAPTVSFDTVSFSDTGVQGDHITKTDSVTLSGSVGDDVHVQTVEVFDNGTSLGLATVSNGTWSLTTAVGQGSHNTWSATATDEAGNTTSAGNTTLVQVDTTAPTVSFDTVSFSDTGVQGDHITKTDSVTLSGSVGDDVHVQTVEVFDNGTSLGLATVSNGTWSLTTAVGQGSHNTWSATATDEAGNTTSAGNTTLVQVDTTAPTVSFDTVSFSDTGVQGDHITKTDSVTLSGSVGDDVHVQTVEVFDNGTSLGLATVSNGTWSLTTAVGQGSHNTWSATATDEAGNTTSAGNTTLVQVDTTAPTVSFDTVSFSDTGVQGDHITKTDSVTLFRLGWR
ncbi:uncharacterized protein YdeI (BOF family) [Bradyrhizobium sp. JR3.5]